MGATSIPPETTGEASDPSAVDDEELRRLARLSASIPELEERLAIVAEGYRLVREAASAARKQADAREARARAVWQALRRRVELASSANRRLKRLLPPEQVAPWHQAELRLRHAREGLTQARRGGRNLERHEAAVEQAETAWRTARAEALGDEEAIEA